MCMSTLSISITVIISRVKTRYIFHFELSLHQSSVRKWVVFLSHIAYVLEKATEYYLILWKYTTYIDSCTGRFLLCEHLLGPYSLEVENYSIKSK